ncbi:MAG: DNRLRE domain-containing protein, partial [Bacteroidota bacterium]
MRTLYASLLCLLFSFPLITAAQSVTISPSQDNTLYQSTNGTLSNGTGQFLFSGRTKQASNSLRRTVLQFDIAGNVPAGATITGATLTLTMNKGTGVSHAHSLFALSQAWGEGSTNASGNEGSGGASTANSATWIHTFFSGSNWTTAGGDFAATASAITNVGGSNSYNWSSPAVTADVQGWYANPSTNFGWILTGNETTA